MNIRKIFKLSLVFVCLAVIAALITEIVGPEKVNAQIPVLTRQYTVTSATAQTSVGLIGNGVMVHRIIWSPVAGSGAVSACSVKLQSSPDNATWSDLIPAQTCTSAGASDFVPFTANYVRVNPTTVTVTGNANIVVRWEGYYAGGAVDTYGYSTYIALSIDSHIIKAGPGVLVSMAMGGTTGGIQPTIACYDSATVGPTAPTVANKNGSYIMGTVGVINTLYLPINTRFTNGLVCQVTGAATVVNVLYR